MNTNELYNLLGHSLLSPFRMVCRDFILPEPASYAFFYPLFNLRNLLYIIYQGTKKQAWYGKITISIILMT